MWQVETRCGLFGSFPSSVVINQNNYIWIGKYVQLMSEDELLLHYFTSIHNKERTANNQRKITIFY